jgi:hypothetical protein
MNAGRVIACGMGLALGLAAAGCQQPPRMVIRDLPVDSILEDRPSPAPARPAPVTRAPAGALPAEWTPSAYARPWRWIVIHHSASPTGSAEVFDRWHRARGWDELGYHFVITNGHGGPDGQVQVGSRWTKQKWGAHCGGTPNNDYNNYGIGICLVGDFSRQLPSRAQRDSLRRLVLALADQYHIAPSDIIGHRDAPGASTDCPGDALHRWMCESLRADVARQQAGIRSTKS